MSIKFKVASVALAVSAACSAVGTVQAGTNVHKLHGWDVDAKRDYYYYAANGEVATVPVKATFEDAEVTITRVTGGYLNEAKAVNTDITVNQGAFRYVSGGNFLSEQSEVAKFSSGTLNTTISGDVAVQKTMIGGHLINGAKNTVTVNTDTVNTTLTGGTYGTSSRKRFDNKFDSFAESEQPLSRVDFCLSDSIIL